MTAAMEAPLIAAVAALLVAHVGARIAARSGPMHAPRAERSSHKVVTPSGGGLGIAAGVFAALLIVALWGLGGLGAEAALRLAGLTAIGLAVAVVGVFDDLYDWPPRLKFALLGAASAGIALVAGGPVELPLAAGLGVPLIAWAGLVGAALWVFTVMNAVNFMDGANGLAGGSVGIASAGLAVLGVLADAPAAALMGAALAGALLGFLPVNAPLNGSGSKVFMGDVGSLTSGAWYAAAGLLLVAEAPRGAVYLPPLLLLPILADALLTIGWHAKRRIPLMKPHLDHAYQLRIRSGDSHETVVRAIWLRAALFAVLAVGGHVALERTGDPAWALGGLVLGAVIAVSVWSAERRRARRRMSSAG